MMMYEYEQSCQHHRQKLERAVEESRHRRLAMGCFAHPLPRPCASTTSLIVSGAQICYERSTLWICAFGQLLPYWVACWPWLATSGGTGRMPVTGRYRLEAMPTSWLPQPFLQTIVHPCVRTWRLWLLTAPALRAMLHRLIACVV